MSFRVEPEAVRQYGADLAAVRQAANAARSYVNKHGLLSAHEKGLIGTVMPSHDNFVDALNRMLGHLGDLLDTSDTALKQLAATYETADEASAAKVDASYPAAPRPPVSRD
uniref:hypothetical protein n=1 Tax=Paractinoplanes polyasparticus TaxID=2856853 RepID=UPI001C84E5A1|nr:hypothetical protein [Actinoplanes polyasparticus]